MAAALALLIALQAAAAAVAPAQPAPDPVQTLRKVVVAAIRNCPVSHGDEIVVCGKDIGEAPPAYRYPRLAGDPGARVNGAGPLPTRPGSTVGASGTGSCSTSGAGGSTGCALGVIDAWAGERRGNHGGWP